MRYIDLHCDTLMHLWQPKPGQTLYENSKTSVDIRRLKAGGAAAQFFAIFLPTREAFTLLGRLEVDDDTYLQELRVILLETIAAHEEEMCLVRSYADLEQAEHEGKLAAFLTIEDGRSITSVEKLRDYYGMGFRLVSLTWNHENCLGFPNAPTADAMAKGLKALGFEVVQEMEQLGMIVDVSHLSDGGFEDVARISKKPFVASHSNARAIGPHRRNLTDAQLRSLAEHGGVAGLNFAPSFLGMDLKNKHSCLDLILDQADYMRRVGGEDVVAIGSDFDGIEGQLDIDSADKMPLLFEDLERRGWTGRQIEKLAYGNAIRVLKATL